MEAIQRPWGTEAAPRPKLITSMFINGLLRLMCQKTYRKILKKKIFFINLNLFYYYWYIFFSLECPKVFLTWTLKGTVVILLRSTRLKLPNKIKSCQQRASQIINSHLELKVFFSSVDNEMCFKLPINIFFSLTNNWLFFSWVNWPVRFVLLTSRQPLWPQAVIWPQIKTLHLTKSF